MAYTTWITDLDPIKYDLLFERFLNPDRISMPDIDTDVAQEGREACIKYLSDKLRRRPRRADLHVRTHAAEDGGQGRRARDGTCPCSSASRSPS